MTPSRPPSIPPSWRDSPTNLSSLNHHRFESLADEGCPAEHELRRVRSRGGSEYSVKCLRAQRPDSTPSSSPERPPLAREIEIHAAVSGHPHILPYKDCFVVDGHYHVVFDTCSGGDLASHVRDGHKLTQDDEIRRVFLQLVSAVRHCHDLGIAHRDLRPENVLARDYTCKTYCLANFGLATTHRWCSKLLVGTKAYMSPECLGTTRWKKEYDTQASDVWSLGIILIFMISSALPWSQAHPAEARYAEYLRDPSFLQSYLPVSESLIPLLSRLLEPDARRRISLVDLEHELERVSTLTISERELESGDAALRVAEARERGLAVELAPPSRSGSGNAPAAQPSPPRLLPPRRKPSLFSRALHWLKRKMR